MEDFFNYEESDLMIDEVYELESKRKKIYLFFKISMFFIILGVLFYIIKVLQDNFSFLPEYIISSPIVTTIFIILTFLFIISIFTLIISKGLFEKTIRNSDALKHILKKILPEAILNDQEGLEISDIKESGLERLYNEFYSDFLIEGIYKDVLYHCANVKIIESKHYNDKAQKRIVHFDGIFFIFELNSNPDTILKVYEKKDFKLTNGLFPVETEFISFNEKFNVFSNDDLKTFYILTPKIQEVILELENTFPGLIELSFINQKMFIGIQSKKTGFKFKINKSITENLDYISKQFELIHKLIDAFKLSSFKFKK